MKNFLICFISVLFIFSVGCAEKIPKHELVPLYGSISSDNMVHGKDGTASMANPCFSGNRATLTVSCRKYLLNMIDKYNDNVMEKADIISSIVFRFHGRAVSALGITKLDGANKSFSVAGLNPMAVTLFKLKMKNGKLVSSYVIPQFSGGHGVHNGLDKAARAIGRDIARIYFNRKIKYLDKSIKFDKYRVFLYRNNWNRKVGTHKTDEVLSCYVFSGSPLILAEKTEYCDGIKLWSVDYYDYRKAGNKEMPFKIFFKNYKYGYTLDVEIKQVTGKECHEPFK